MTDIPFARRVIFPRSAFSRLAIPIVQPPAGVLKPTPSRGHSTVRGLWK